MTKSQLPNNTQFTNNQIKKVTLSSAYKIDRQYWAKFNFDEQMGNIGSEVSRAIKAKQNGNEESLIGAFYRALDLFNASLEVLKNNASQYQEVKEANQKFVAFFQSKNSNPKDFAQLDGYFYAYALVARKDR